MSKQPKGTPLSPSQRARDALRISELYLHGKTQWEIGQELGRSQPVISRALKKLQESWRQSTLVNINEAKQRELSRIDLLERTYWDAWERSCQEAKRKATKTKGAIVKPLDGPGGAKFVQETPTEQTFFTQDQVGDKRFLEGVQWCIDRRCKILGVDAPLKVAPTAPTGDKAFDGIERGATRFTEYIDRILAYRSSQEDSGPGVEGGTSQS